MSKAKYTKLIKELHQGLNEAAEEMPDIDSGQIAFEVAENVLIDEVWVKPYLKKMGVSDFQGRVADDIYSGK